MSSKLKIRIINLEKVHFLGLYYIIYVKMHGVRNLKLLKVR